MNHPIQETARRKAIVKIATLLLVAASAGALLPVTASAFDPNPATRPPQGAQGSGPFTVLQRVDATASGNLAPAPTPRPSGSAPTPCTPNSNDLNDLTFSTSRYISYDPNTTNNLSRMNSAGQAVARTIANTGRDCAVILDMDEAGTQGGQEGVFIRPNHSNFIPDNIVYALVQYFVDGYMTAAPNPSSHITLIIGVNLFCSIPSNGCVVDDYNQHGMKWANMIDSINTYIQAIYGQRANMSAAGGGDLETGYNNATNSIAWVQGFQDAHKGLLMYDYGDAGACPGLTDASVNSPCGDANHAWTQSDVWMVAWGLPASVAFPEIYFDGNPRMADQWAQISQVGQVQHAGQSITFYGVLTQFQKCKNSNFTIVGCSDASRTQFTISPYTALTELQGAANQTITWSSDIMDEP